MAVLGFGKTAEIETPAAIEAASSALGQVSAGTAGRLAATRRHRHCVGERSP